jgi:hypothetical protein
MLTARLQGWMRYPWAVFWLTLAGIMFVVTDFGLVFRRPSLVHTLMAVALAVLWASSAQRSLTRRQSRPRAAAYVACAPLRSRYIRCVTVCEVEVYCARDGRADARDRAG